MLRLKDVNSEDHIPKKAIIFMERGEEPGFLDSEDGGRII